MDTPRAGHYTWRKSTYSGGSGGNCVEVGVTWHKSAYSSDQGGNCVEVAATPEYVGIRDTKNRPLGHLTVTPAAWRAFVKAITW